MDEDTSPVEISRTQKLFRRHKVLLVIISTLILFIGILALSLVLYTWDRGRIANGVVLEIPLGQISIEEAQSKLEQLKEEIYKSQVRFISDEKRFIINREELGFTFNYQEPLQQAYLIGREGTILAKAVNKFKASWGINFNPDFQWNDSVLIEALSKHLSSLKIPAEDARFIINPDNSLQIVPEKIGKEVDIDSLKAIIKEKPLNDDKEILIPFKEVKPIIMKTDLENVKTFGLLSNFTTRFDPTLKERTLNIKLAANAINGMVLKPGGVFSFNDTVGPRTVEAGYGEAMIIEGNTFVPGLGGGVCQVSSTLYNAVRIASPSLRVLERSRHSLPVTYVPSGQDATVAYPNLDFKFKNETDSYLLIRSSLNSNTLNFSIYGRAKP